MTRFSVRRFSALTVFFFGFLAAFASGADTFKIPAMSSPVVDQIGLLSPREKTDLEQSLFNFKRDHQAQIQILIIENLGDEPIESATIKVFDQWKIGDEKRDDGILLLVAAKEKRMRIEVGQGLEGSIPDVVAKRIISDIMRPFFQRGQFYQGIRLAVVAIQGEITQDPLASQELNQAQQNAYQQPAKKKKTDFSSYVFVFIFFIWLIIFIVSPSTGLSILYLLMSRGGRGGGSSGGGSWGGGGGRSSGGGASGGW
jgi:uncharacterized protein